MKYFLLPLALTGLLLTGCSSNPNAIEPNDLPDFDASYKVKRLWKEGVGDGVEESQLTPVSYTHLTLPTSDLV